ncbi:hypothetical protein [Shewanella sp. Isolate11]|uniref:hypothetical protein n=1 Tax=Shewanella sp. Isolate11 TaxID=2908530 RepID=UPI001EFE318B|nr:hypothetical protein [Shewanella sp. Isolate11]MCG9697751.1 hypothetical protein [Shewanella sp. Isolate11]
MTTKSEQLDCLIANTTKEITPERDLWQQIERRLDAPLAKKNHYWKPVAIASLLVLSLVVGQKFVTTQPEVVPSNELLLTLASIKAQHQQQVELLQTQAVRVNWQSSPYGQPVEQGIEQLRSAAELIYQSLQLNPTDKQLWQLWLWTQQREIDLVKQGQQLPVNHKQKGDVI